MRVLRRQFGDGGCSPKNDLQVGNQIHHELSVRTQSLTKRMAPVTEFVFALPQEGADQLLKGLRKSGVGMSRLYWSNFRRKQAARRNQHLVQLVHDGGFADPE